MPPSAIPAIRVRRVNDRPVRPDGDFVLYWMIAFRRVGWNFALDRAIEWARELGKPLVILEALRAGYPWASDRLHRFVLDGMADTERRLPGMAVTYTLRRQMQLVREGRLHNYMRMLWGKKASSGREGPRTRSP